VVGAQQVFLGKQVTTDEKLAAPSEIGEHDE
jgi:hypothetical protein